MLRKITHDYVIPGVAEVIARSASIACAVPPPAPTDPGAGIPAPVTPPGIQPGDPVFVYIPRYFTLYTGEETRTPSTYPAPAGYTCSTGVYLVSDPAFPNGMTPVYETRCYWNYP